MNVVILGCGRTGSMLTRTLIDTGHRVTVIDIDRRAAETLPAQKIADGQITVIEGDGSRDEAMEAADIRDADLFLALTGDDALNGLAALKARATFRVMTVIAAMWSGDLSSVYEAQGVACVNPGRLTTENIIAHIPQALQAIKEQRP
jgi:trk system potassium uptake protein TrkA